MISNVKHHLTQISKTCFCVSGPEPYLTPSLEIDNTTVVSNGTRSNSSSRMRNFIFWKNLQHSSLNHMDTWAMPGLKVIYTDLGLQLVHFSGWARAVNLWRLIIMWTIPCNCGIMNMGSRGKLWHTGDRNTLFTPRLWATESWKNAWVLDPRERGSVWPG